MQKGETHLFTNKTSVSVVISVYNGQKFIFEQLSSILNQSVQPDEVLIIDDCSCDESITICQQFIEKNELKNWKIIQNSSNLGWIKSFQNGALLAKGDYIFFCDQDDIWKTNKIEKTLSIFHLNKDALVVGSYETLLFPNSAKKNMSKQKMDYIKITENDIWNYVHNPNGCTMAISRRFIDLTKQYWIKDWAHDAQFWRLGFFLEGAYLIRESLIYHRITGVNVSRRKVHDKNERLAGIKVHLQHLRKLKCLIIKLHLNHVNLLEWEEEGQQERLNLIENGGLKSFFKLNFKFSKLFLSRKSIFADYLSHFNLLK